MEKTNYPLCCYSNGEIVVEEENVFYKDGEPFFVFVNSNHNFDERTSLICEELEVNRSEFGLDIKMKYPNARGYKVLSLNNDKSLKALWASVYQMNASSMDLYISLILIQQPRNLFTNMLNQAMRGENPLFSAPFSSNSVDQEQYDLNSNDDEIDEDEDELLMNESDDECEDLVTPFAPTIEFSRVPSIDLEYVNRWCGKVDVPCYDGGEFLVGQRKPSPCDWTLRASNKEATNDSFTIVTYKGPHNTSCVVDAPPLDHPNLSNGFIAKHIRTMDPGPDDGRILHLQSTHRSEAIWQGVELEPLTLRGHMKALKAFEVPEAVLTYVNNTQFRGITRLCYVPLDADLITALVERWRQETHTFHLPFGATPSTVALKGSKLKLTWLHDNFQNVANINSQYQLHCRVRAYLLYLFGALLFPDKTGNTASLIYLPLLENLDQIDDISWGRGVLACLYRNLCKATKVDCIEIAGPLLLLQLWSWERVSIGRPDIVRSRVPRQAGVAYPLGSQVLTEVDPLACKWLRVQRGFKDHRLGLVVIRDLLDKMVELQFVWQPYTPSVVQHLSPTCVQDQAEWTVIAPLICFEMVEWHFPNRCTRQFGWQQKIPEMGSTCTRLHDISRKGDWSTNYETMHQESIAKWENRMSKIVEPWLPFCGLMSFEEEYFEWYNAITRRIITPLGQNVNDDYEDHHYYYPTAADFQILTQANMVTYNTTEQMISNMPDNIPLAQYAMIEKMRNMSLNSLVNTGQGHLINYQEPTPPSPPRYDFRHLAHRQPRMTQESEEAESSQRTRKKGKKRN
ncbi:hypothetical protein KSS87_002622 [Heliosperma pusillum]|nr:hypothetical protein KSS87_002622 [Heliosperma pusillum]